MEHEVTNDWNPICNMRLPTVKPYMHDEVTNSRHAVAKVCDPMCYMRLPMIGILHPKMRS